MFTFHCYNNVAIIISTPGSIHASDLHKNGLKSPVQH